MTDTLIGASILCSVCMMLEIVRDVGCRGDINMY